DEPPLAVLLQRRVVARDVAVGETNRIRLGPTEPVLLVGEGELGLFPLVVFDRQLPHRTVPDGGVYSTEQVSPNATLLGRGAAELSARPLFSVLATKKTAAALLEPVASWARAWSLWRLGVGLRASPGPRLCRSPSAGPRFPSSSNPRARYQHRLIV